MVLAFFLIAQGQAQQPLEPLKQAEQAPPVPPPAPLPPPPPEGEAKPFTTQDGKKGWKVTIPGGHPLATPAVKDNLVLVGGGFGSHEFYALDAATGKVVWQYRTKDDGPTAAIVEGDWVIFNTESCEIEALQVRTGKPVWKKWLGDPLMSTPAAADGRIYIVFPDSKGDKNHYLTCLDLANGKEFWRKKIDGEIITTPVIADGKVYVSCVVGTTYCFKLAEGDLVFSEKKNATSSPCVWKGEWYVSFREEVKLPRGGVGQQEGQAKSSHAVAGSVQSADYLDLDKKKNLESEAKKVKADAGVGFGAAKGDAKIQQAQDNLGEQTVAGVWAYQGSKPFIFDGRHYSCMGNNVKCLEPKEGKVVWEREIKKGDTPLAERTLTPPATVNGKLFIGTTHGDILCLSAKDGSTLWTASVGAPIVFQPAVVGGRVFVGTAHGTLVCVETGDSKDDGWAMWGATPRHNGLGD